MPPNQGYFLNFLTIEILCTFSIDFHRIHCVSTKGGRSSFTPQKRQYKFYDFYAIILRQFIWFWSKKIELEIKILNFRVVLHWFEFIWNSWLS